MKRMNRTLVGVTTVVAGLALFALGARTGSDGHAGQREEGKATVLISDVLPEALADYIKRFGVDRDLDVPAGHEYLQRDIVEVDAIAVVDTLRPRVYFVLRGPVTLLEQIASPNKGSDDSQARAVLIAGSNAALEDGGQVPLGTEFALGDSIAEGIVLNSGDVDVLVSNVLTRTVLGSGELLVISPQDSPEAPAKDGDGASARAPGGGAVSNAACRGCSTSCSAGYFACCNFGGILTCASCKCVRNGTSSDCDAGGSGANSCSVAN